MNENNTHFRSFLFISVPYFSSVPHWQRSTTLPSQLAHLNAQNTSKAIVSPHTMAFLISLPKRFCLSGESPPAVSFLPLLVERKELRRLVVVPAISSTPFVADEGKFGTWYAISIAEEWFLRLQVVEASPDGRSSGIMDDTHIAQTFFVAEVLQTYTCQFVLFKPCHSPIYASTHPLAWMGQLHE